MEKPKDIEYKICPRCLQKKLYAIEVKNALSRRDNETYICSDCGIAEALEDLQQCDFIQDDCENILVIYKIKKDKVFALYTNSDKNFGSFAEITKENIKDYSLYTGWLYITNGKVTDYSEMDFLKKEV